MGGVVGGGSPPICVRLWCGGSLFPLGLGLSLPSWSLLPPPSPLINPGETLYSDLGGKVHLGSARGALAMATVERNEGEDLEQMIPMKEVLGSTLHNFSLMVREALKVDQCILCNSCWLCRGCEATLWVA